VLIPKRDCLALIQQSLDIPIMAARVEITKAMMRLIKRMSLFTAASLFCVKQFR
jgi:hypothetical protein